MDTEERKQIEMLLQLSAIQGSESEAGVEIRFPVCEQHLRQSVVRSVIHGWEKRYGRRSTQGSVHRAACVGIEYPSAYHNLQYLAIMEHPIEASHVLFFFADYASPAVA